MYTLISGSPKPIASNSLNFLKIIGSSIDNYNMFELKKKSYQEITQNIALSEAVIFAFPLYVDSPTSITLEFLDYIIDKQIKLDNKIIYLIINCGFREGFQNITAVNIMKRWCEKVNAIYGGSILIGAGEIVGKEKYKFVSSKALKKLKDFTDIVKSKQKCNEIITTMDLINNKLYCYLANLSWIKKGKINSLSNTDLRIQ